MRRAGVVATIEEAEDALKISWERWLAWAGSTSSRLQGLPSRIWIGLGVRTWKVIAGHVENWNYFGRMTDLVQCAVVLPS
jgi:hypothetical protein